MSALESLFLKVDGINVKCASLAAIADSCPNLRVIFIADIGQNVKVAMLDHLIGNCLELAVIEGCSHISNKQQSLLLQTRIKKLKLQIKNTNCSYQEYSIYSSLKFN